MEVILIEDMGKLGTVGEQVSVRDGYGRNFLIPKKLAIPASVKNQRQLEHEKKVAGFRMKKMVADAAAAAEKLSATSITIARKVGEQDKLYGSVTTHDIERALKDEGIKVDRRKIILTEPIRALGVYQVPVKLTPEKTAEIKVWVVAES